MLGVVLGAVLFGIGMVLYGYCPGTGVAALATGSLHALVGFAGMLVGGVLYALSFTWVEAHIQKVAALGKVRLPDLTGVPDWGWFVIRGDCRSGVLADRNPRGAAGVRRAGSLQGSNALGPGFLIPAPPR